MGFRIPRPRIPSLQKPQVVIAAAIKPQTLVAAPKAQPPTIKEQPVENPSSAAPVRQLRPAACPPDAAKKKSARKRKVIMIVGAVAVSTILFTVGLLVGRRKVHA